MASLTCWEDEMVVPSPISSYPSILTGLLPFMVSIANVFKPSSILAGTLNSMLAVCPAFMLQFPIILGLSTLSALAEMSLDSLIIWCAKDTMSMAFAAYASSWLSSTHWRSHSGRLVGLPLFRLSKYNFHRFR